MSLLETLARNHFLQVGLSLVQQILSAIAALAQRRYEISGLQRHVELQMSDIIATSFARRFECFSGILRRCQHAFVLPVTECNVIQRS